MSSSFLPANLKAKNAKSNENKTESEINLDKGQRWAWQSDPLGKMSSAYALPPVFNLFC